MGSGQVLGRNKTLRLHESPNPMGQVEVMLTQDHWAEVVLEEVNGKGGRTLRVNGRVFVTKVSHTVVVDFGCDQHKQPLRGTSSIRLNSSL